MNEKQELQQLQAQFPDWDITRVFGAYRAVPKGTPLIEAVYLDSLRDKLAEREWAEPPRRRQSAPWFQPAPEGWVVSRLLSESVEPRSLPTRRPARTAPFDDEPPAA